MTTVNEKTKRIALITGGSRGLGRNTAMHLARAGVDVIVTYQSKKAAADEVVKYVESLGGKAAALQLDVAKSKSFGDFAAALKTALRDTWGRDRFDFLVNNAGTGLYKPFAETTEEDFDELLNVHFKGVYFLTQKLLPLIQDGGRIVNVSSGLARFAMVGSSAYGSM